MNIARDIFPGRIPDGYVPNVWTLKDSGLSEDEISQVWEKAKGLPSFWAQELPYVENVRSMWDFLNLRSDGSLVYYITSRVPTYVGPSVMVQTQGWLYIHGLLRFNTAVLPVVHNHPSGTPPKSLIVEALDIDAMIDDYLPTVMSLGEKGWLLDRPWNREGRSSKIQVVKTLQEFLEKF